MKNNLLESLIGFVVVLIAIIFFIYSYSMMGNKNSSKTYEIRDHESMALGRHVMPTRIAKKSFQINFFCHASNCSTCRSLTLAFHDCR